MSRSLKSFSEWGNIWWQPRYNRCKITYNLWYKQNGSCSACIIDCMETMCLSSGDGKVPAAWKKNVQLGWLQPLKKTTYNNIMWYSGSLTTTFCRPSALVSCLKASELMLKMLNTLLRQPGASELATAQSLIPSLVPSWTTLMEASVVQPFVMDWIMLWW